MELDGYMLSPDSYLFKTSSLKDYTAYGFSARENLLFYVMISPEELNEFKIDSTGKMEGGLSQNNKKPCQRTEKGLSSSLPYPLDP